VVFQRTSFIVKNKFTSYSDTIGGNWRSLNRESDVARFVSGKII
jgi:hypothetical protein